MDKIIIAIVALIAGGYLFRRYYLAFKRKDPACGCVSCDGSSGQGPCSCRSLVLNSGIEEKFDNKA